MQAAADNGKRNKGKYLGGGPQGAPAVDAMGGFVAMKLRHSSALGLCGFALFFGLSATPAAAYIGPGLGLGVIASIFGAIAAFLMMIAGLVWYPVKVMLRKRREKKMGATEGAQAPATVKADANPGSSSN